MIRLNDLYRIVGRRPTQKLIRAGWIVPVQSGPGGTTFEAEKVHRALGRLTREGYTLLPRALFPPTKREEARKDAPSLKDIVLDEEAIARLLE
jgi:hypothetical protein